MTKEELAKKLNCIEYPCRYEDNLMVTAKENGLVIVRGHSDDVGMLEGTIHDEFYEKTPINANGPLQSECDEGNDAVYLYKALSALNSNTTKRD